MRSRTREAKLRIFDQVRDSQSKVPHLATTNPSLWEFGHVAWFQALCCLRQGAGRLIDVNDRNSSERA
ncbi:MAG: hypothetical protein KJZ83_11190 [Burkholderiaceae bacterium]|nr:hypothetical protein [Burkholderiaceae bacterium]